MGGIAIVTIGADAARHLRHRADHLLLATLPLLLGVHQLIESLIWWQLQGHLPHLVGRVALWLYLLIAFVVLPVFVPVAVLLLEKTSRLDGGWRRSSPWVRSCRWCCSSPCSADRSPSS